MNLWQIDAGVSLASLVLIGLLANVIAGARLVPMPAGDRRIGSIDGLRGYLALCVACHHFFIWMVYTKTRVWSVPDNNLFANFGQAAVAIFFMITGTLFYAKIIRPNGAKKSWIGLYIGRLFRLMPLVFAVSIITHLGVFASDEFHLQVSLSRFLRSVIQWSLLKGPGEIGDRTEVASLMSNVVWSLRYEWIYYICLPALALISFISNRFMHTRWSFLVGYLLFTLLISQFAFHNIEGKFFFPFAAGALAYDLSKTELAARLATKMVATIGVVSLIASLLIFQTSYAIAPYIMLAVFYIPVVAGNSYFGALKARGSLFLGEISYGIYLWHSVIIGAFLQSMAPLASSPWVWAALPLLLAVVVVVATITFISVEQPFINLGNRFRRQLQSSIAALRIARP